MNYEIETFLIGLSESEECKQIEYKCFSMRTPIGLYYSMRRGIIEPFMIPFRDYIIRLMHTKSIDVDELVKYMIQNDESHCALFLVSTFFKHKDDISELDYYNLIAEYNVLTPFTNEVDMESLALIVIAFVFDNVITYRTDINEIVGNEVFINPVNQYGLTKVNGATFKRNGLIFDGKGYLYNYFTNKTMLSPYDSMVGFAKIINDEANNCDVLYRLDERLSMPESEYHDFSGVPFAKFRGPQFNFNKNSLTGKKTITVHMNLESQDKLLMVVKQCTDQNGEEFWHIEIETLPHIEKSNGYVVTTFLHGMYYPEQNIFTHIDYTKNQYSEELYLQKYSDSNDGISIDQYTSKRDLHYKIWCIENGRFTRETWYKLMIISLSEEYQTLLNEILGQ